MPSEQTKGSPRLSSDVYAVGMIGIQALTGIMPHKLTEDPVTGEISWRQHAQVSPILADILDKMVRYDFRQRYQSAEEALQALQYQQNFSQDVSPTLIPTRSTELHELTLEWFEDGQIRTQKILENQPTKHPEVFRIGRDPAVCNLVLSEPTVSRLHVEIFFRTQQRCFYVRPMNQNNPPAIDGQFFITGEALLHQGTILRLGQMEFRVSTSFNQYPAGYVPHPPSAPYVAPQPLPPTRRPPLAIPRNRNIIHHPFHRNIVKKFLLNHLRCDRLILLPHRIYARDWDGSFG